MVAVGGDIPPELTPGELQRVPAAIMVRGTADNWYTTEKFAADEQRLQQCGVRVGGVEFPTVAHEWSGEVVAARCRNSSATAVSCRTDHRFSWPASPLPHGRGSEVVAEPRA